MIKSKLILLILLLGYSYKTIAMSQDEIILELGSQKSKQFNSARKALWDHDIDSFLNIIETNRIDINNVFFSKGGYNIFGQVVTQAIGENTLGLVKYLLQHGADVNHPIRTKNAKHWPNLTALQSVIQFDIRPELILDFIKLLLDYGAVIDNKTEELVKTKSSQLKDRDNIYTKVLNLFNDHRKTISEAQTNPTQELLLQAINNDQPYIVKLIVNNKPELVTREDFNLAEKKSPYSAHILKRALAIQKFEESELVQERLPLELVERVKNFTLHK